MPINKGTNMGQSGERRGRSGLSKACRSQAMFICPQHRLMVPNEAIIWYILPLDHAAKCSASPSASQNALLRMMRPHTSRTMAGALAAALFSTARSASSGASRTSMRTRTSTHAPGVWGISVLRRRESTSRTELVFSSSSSQCEGSSSLPEAER